MDAGYVDTRNPGGFFLYSSDDRSCLRNVVGSSHLETREERGLGEMGGQEREMARRRKRRREKAS